MDSVLPLLYDMVLPNDSIHDSSIPARDRLIASLQHLLAPEGFEIRPRDAWLRTFDRYVTMEPSPEARAEYLAIEQELRRRVEYCLTVLQDEGSIAHGDNARRAMFLLTVVSGISIMQALPAEAAGVQNNIDVLNTAVDYVLCAQGVSG